MFFRVILSFSLISLYFPLSSVLALLPWPVLALDSPLIPIAVGFRLAGLFAAVLFDWRGLFLSLFSFPHGSSLDLLVWLFDLGFF